MITEWWLSKGHRNALLDFDLTLKHSFIHATHIIQPAEVE